jgi:Tol biopolymer transport system component
MIAFNSNRDGNQEIYVMNADGSDPVRLTFNAAEDARAGWSPDGKQIVFDRRVETGHFEVFVMNADGADQTRLTTSVAGAFSGFGSWGVGPVLPARGPVISGD